MLLKKSFLNDGNYWNSKVYTHSEVSFDLVLIINKSAERDNSRHPRPRSYNEEVRPEDDVNEEVENFEDGERAQEAVRPDENPPEVLVKGVVHEVHTMTEILMNFGIPFEELV